MRDLGEVAEHIHDASEIEIAEGPDTGGDQTLLGYGRRRGASCDDNTERVPMQRLAQYAFRRGALTDV
jgi:hypothetical protein